MDKFCWDHILKTTDSNTQLPARRTYTHAFHYYLLLKSDKGLKRKKVNNTNRGKCICVQRTLISRETNAIRCFPLFISPSLRAVKTQLLNPSKGKVSNIRWKHSAHQELYTGLYGKLHKYFNSYMQKSFTFNKIQQILVRTQCKRKPVDFSWYYLWILQTPFKQNFLPQM